MQRVTHLISRHVDDLESLRDRYQVAGFNVHKLDVKGSFGDPLGILVGEYVFEAFYHIGAALSGNLAVGNFGLIGSGAC